MSRHLVVLITGHMDRVSVSRSRKASLWDVSLTVPLAQRLLGRRMINVARGGDRCAVFGQVSPRTQRPRRVVAAAWCTRSYEASRWQMFNPKSDKAAAGISAMLPLAVYSWVF